MIYNGDPGFRQMKVHFKANSIVEYALSKKEILVYYLSVFVDQ